jgi:hypothetical protein
MPKTKLTKIERKSKPLRDEELCRLVHEFRYRLRQNGVSTLGIIPLASLLAILESHGVEAELMIADMGDDHFWLRLPDGRALDVFPPLYLGPPRTYHLQSDPTLPTGEHYDPATGELYEPVE